jgi:hypothetical protein
MSPDGAEVSDFPTNRLAAKAAVSQKVRFLLGDDRDAALRVGKGARSVNRFGPRIIGKLC